MPKAKQGKPGKPGNPTPRMSMLSAALTIHAWTLEHGRPPKVCECKSSNGLYHWQTYYEVFGMHNFSAGILPMVSALVSGVELRHCIGRLANGTICNTPFPKEGSHIRMCQPCRRRWADDDTGEHSIPMSVTRLTLRELGAGRGGWDAWDGWVRNVEWNG